MFERKRPPADKALGKSASWTVCQSAPRRAPHNDSRLCSERKQKVAEVQSEMTHFTLVSLPGVRGALPHWLMSSCQAI